MRNFACIFALWLPLLSFAGPKVVTSTTEVHWTFDIKILSWGASTSVTETETVGDDAPTTAEEEPSDDEQPDECPVDDDDTPAP